MYKNGRKLQKKRIKSTSSQKKFRTRLKNLENLAEFVLPYGVKLTLKNPYRKKNLQNTTFPQKVTVDSIGTLLTSLPNVFRKLLSAVSTRNLNIFGIFYFSSILRDIWSSVYIDWLLFWQAFHFFPTERHRTSRTKCKNNENTLNISKRFFSQKNLRTRRMLFWQPRSFCFAKMHKTYTQTAKKKKTNHQKTSFPQNVTVDKTSIILKSLPRSFWKLFFSVSTRKLKICTFVSVFFYQKCVFFGTLLMKFWQPVWVSFPEGRKVTLKVSEGKKIFRETNFIKLFLCTRQKQFCQVGQRTFGHFLRGKYAKTKSLWISHFSLRMMFSSCKRLFWQPFSVFSIRRLGTFRSKYKNDEKPPKTGKKTLFFPKNF